MMLDAGILDGATEAICTHCDNTIPVGKLSLCKGDYMAACIPLTLRFLGKTSHAAFPEQGVDAVAMAVEAYGEMKKAVKEEARGGRYIWCVGRLSGGEAHNVVPDCCEMNISFRFFRTPPLDPHSCDPSAQMTSLNDLEPDKMLLGWSSEDLHRIQNYYESNFIFPLTDVIISRICYSQY